MHDLTDLKRPEGIDWQAWLERYDRMHEQYFVKRDERFRMITRLISETQDHPMRVLDLGCGTGALMLSILEALPQVEVVGIDLDPAVLWLSAARLERFGRRCRLLMTDFLAESWTRTLDGPLDAVVSTQTFHMLGTKRVARLYQQIAQVLRPGGIFLSADHVRSDSPAIQQAWERERGETNGRETPQDVDDWDGFWKEYSEALAVDLSEAQGRLYGGSERGARERLPLVWHLNRLLENGFGSAECFWRGEFDALYGGERSL